MITQRRPTVLTSLSVMTLLMASPAGAEIVFDPSVFARQFEQLTELKKQVDTLTSQLKVAQDQLNQAKQLYDSFNKRTNANDIGALLNTPQFRKVLPQQFSDIEKSASRGRVAAILRIRSTSISIRIAPMPATAAIRITRASSTGSPGRPGPSTPWARRCTIPPRSASMHLRSSEPASARRPTPRRVLDLSARLQAEQALLQNDVLRMQGLAMIQQARVDMDGQREREKQRQLVDEIKAALQ